MATCELEAALRMRVLRVFHRRFAGGGEHRLVAVLAPAATEQGDELLHRRLRRALLLRGALVELRQEIVALGHADAVRAAEQRGHAEEEQRASHIRTSTSVAREWPFAPSPA